MSIDTDNFSFATFLSVNNGDYFGSGFRIITATKQYLITAKHVLYVNDHLLQEVWIKSRNYNGELYEAFDAVIDLSPDNVTTFGNSDLAVVELHIDYGLHITSKGLNIAHVEIDDLVVFEDIKISQGIFLVGYPSSLVTNDDFYENDRPLLRYGIIAGKNTNQNTFIIDALAYYGVSGGPILKIDDQNKLKVLGVVSRYVPFITEWKNKYEMSLIRHDFYNSGYAVCERLDEIINFITNREQ